MVAYDRIRKMAEDHGWTILAYRNAPNPPETFYAAAVVKEGDKMYSVNTHSGRSGFAVTHEVTGNPQEQVNMTMKALKRLMEET